jgi:hypothetical protein
MDCVNLLKYKQLRPLDPKVERLRVNVTSDYRKPDERGFRGPVLGTPLPVIAPAASQYRVGACCARPRRVLLTSYVEGYVLTSRPRVL